MKKVLILVGVLAATQVGWVGVHADVYTFQPTESPSLWGLDHNWHYTWGLKWSAPEGEQVVRAVLTYVNIDNWKQPETNLLYTHLLGGLAAPGSRAGDSDWVISENSRRHGSDNFAGQGLALPEYVDAGPGKDTVSFEIPAEYLSWLSGGFGFGIDPHCSYTNDGIVLRLETAPIVTSAVPVPGAALLSAVGLGLVGWAKRRLA